MCCSISKSKESFLLYFVGVRYLEKGIFVVLVEPAVHEGGKVVDRVGGQLGRGQHGLVRNPLLGSDLGERNVMKHS